MRQSQDAVKSALLATRIIFPLPAPMSEREPYPSEKQERFIVRLPDGMRDRIKLAADANNRSMNAEIVATLEERYPAPPPDPQTVGHLLAVVEDLIRNLPSREVNALSAFPPVDIAPLKQAREHLAALAKEDPHRLLSSLWDTEAP